MSVQTNCPACGGPIAFKVGSAIVTVCPFCRSVVARGDRRFEDLGKVAALVDTDSPLDIGLKGRYQNVPFELTGRAQLSHPAGGVWDEWYAAFADGRWGWLAEAQGRFFFTFQQKTPPPGALPPFAQLSLGQPVTGVPWLAKLIVAEKNQARAVAAQGEIPYRLVPGQSYDYADLSGPGGTFATLDYSEGTPLVFAGREVTLDQLGLPPSARHDERHTRRIEALQLSCPHCAGPLELRAPDKTERVTCPNCGSLLDVSAGKLQFFQAIEPRQVKPIIPLGAVGRFAEGELTVIGYLVRRVKIEHVKYFWEEYLLYEPRLGFRWLACSDDHWSYIQPLPPGEVSTARRKAAYHGQEFKLFQKDVATVEYVLGEFYWKVGVDEAVEMADFIRPPLMLSQEVSIPHETGEINWSLGTYTPPAAIQKVFQLGPLPRPSGVAPNQPFLHKQVYRLWGVFLLLAVLLGLVFLARGSHRKVYEETFWLTPLTGTEKTHVFFSHPFELHARRNLRIEASAGVDNSWVEVGGDLIDEATGLIQPFEIAIEYYHGVDGGESWSEGDQTGHVYLSAMPAGTYTLRIEVESQKPEATGTIPVDPQTQEWMREHKKELEAQNAAVMNGAVIVRIYEGVPRLWHWFLAVLALSVLPIGVLFYHWYFEWSRWKDSPYSPYNQGSSE